jgi:hypothetical protein
MTKVNWERQLFYLLTPALMGDTCTGLTRPDIAAALLARGALKDAALRKGQTGGWPTPAPVPGVAVPNVATNGMADATGLWNEGGGDSRTPRPCHKSRCAVSCVHPSASRHGPSLRRSARAAQVGHHTSGPVQVNLGNSSAGSFTVEIPAGRWTTWGSWFPSLGRGHW